MEKNGLFSFPLPYPYNNRICITGADTEESDVEAVVICRILFRICTHKSIQIDWIFGAVSICDLVLNIDYLAEISRFFELLSAQVFYPGFRVAKIVPALQTCMSALIEEKRP